MQQIKLRPSAQARQLQENRKNWLKDTITVVALLPVLWAIAILYLSI